MNKNINEFEINILIQYNVITLEIYNKETNKKCLKSFNKNKIEILPINIKYSIDEIYNHCLLSEIKINKLNNINEIIFLNNNIEIKFMVYDNDFNDNQQYQIINKLNDIEKTMLSIKKYEINLFPNIGIPHLILAYITLNSLERILKIIYKN